ncbi:MAG: Crp/Fnr family transcriptional regulator [Granulosicoccaceae bacterium]|jgi:CRP-like cAMP-binding protein
MDFIEFLQGVPEFSQLSSAELEILEKSMLVRDYPDGYKFIEEGKTADNVYLIIDGDVVVTRKKRRGVQPINRLRAGDLFGLVSLIDHGKRSASCTAAGPVKAASLPLSAFELLETSHVPLANHFQTIVAHQLLRDMRSLTNAIRKILVEHDTLDSQAGLQAVAAEYSGPERRKQP